MTNPYLDLVDDGGQSPAPQPGPAANNPYMDVAGDLAQAQSSRAALAVGFASSGSADRAAENMQLAKRFNVPSDVVDKWPDQFRQYAITDGAKAALQSAPVLQNQIAERPELAKILHDDVPGNAAIEQTMQAWNPSVGERFTSWMRDILGVTERNRASAMNEVAARSEGLTMGQAREAFGGMSEVPEQAAGGAINSASFGLVPNLAGEAQTNLGKVGEGAGALAGFIYGGPVKMAEWGLGKIGVLGALKAAETDSKIVGAAKIIAAESATLGTASALGEAGNAIDSGSVGEGLGKVALAGAKGAATGALFGSVKNLLPGDSMLQLLGRVAANNVGNDLIQGTRPWDDRPLEQKVFDYGLNSFFSLDGAHPAVRDAAKADFAMEDAQKVAALSQLAAASKWRERDPDGFKQFVSDVADQSGTPDLYVDAKSFAQVLDQSGIKGEELIQQMPEVAQQMREGLQTEGMVKIPLEDYATHIAGSTVDQALQEHLRTAPDGMTLGEAKTYYQEQAQRMKDAATDAVGEKANDELFKASGDKVEEAVRSQLEATGRFPNEVNKAYAAMHRAFFDTTAAKDEKGRLPHELMQEYGLDVRGDQLPGASYDQSAYHGSPHDFDKFSLDHIGTGEGAQAYGHGLYFAEDPGVAGGYHRALAEAPGMKSMKLGSMLLNERNSFDYSRKAGTSDLENVRASLAEDVMIHENDLRGGDFREGVLKMLDEKIKNYEEEDAGPKYIQAAKDLRTMLSAPGALKIEYHPAKGGVYRVDIPDEHVANFLHWDKPLSEQPELVQKAVAGIHSDRALNPDGMDMGGGARILDNRDGQAKPDSNAPWILKSGDSLFDLSQKDVDRMLNGESGENIYTRLTLEKGSQEAASKYLDSLGIKGIKYLDGNSRGDGEGTHNLVVFDDKIINLTHKDGKPVGDAERATYLQGHQPDLFPKDFATKRTTVDTGIKISSSTGETLKGGNVNSEGQQITATKQGLQNFWKWFGHSEATDDKGKPLVLYHSTNADTDVLKDGQKTTNNYGLLGDVDLTRSGIFLTPDRKFSQEYLRAGEGQNVMQLYAKLEKPLDLRGGMTPETENELVDAGINRRWLFDYRQHDWEMFDNADDGTNHFVDTLKQLGYDGAIFHEEGQDGKSHETYVVFDGAQLKSATGNKGTFDPDSSSVLNQDARGQIAFGKDITETPSIISLLKNADLSTFLHESGHFFLEVTSDLAAKAGADSAIGKDFQKALDWMGVKDADTWRAMSADEKREFHEKFARGFEQYLMEGRAPTVGLQGLFGRFRSWLMSIYKSSDALKAELTPEVRGVFDRMLASEEQIQQTEQVRGLLPLFTEKPEGMNEDAWGKYQAEQQQATEDAIANLQSKSIRDMQWISNAKAKMVKALTKEGAEQRRIIRGQVTKEVDAMPAFAAKDFLRENKGADPEMVAEKFGFTSAEEMAQSIADHGNKKDAIEGMTDQRMLQEHGELTDPQSIERAAEAAIHNDVRTRVLARELNALAKATGSPRLLAKAAGEAADAAINAKKVGELSPRQYQVAEGKAGKAAMDAMKKGDTQTAAIQKRAQLLNNVLAKKAGEAQEAVQKILTYMKRFERVSTLKNINPEERDQILKLLANYDFRKNPTEEPTRAQKNLQQWLESQQQAGYTPVVDPAALAAQPRTQYRDMTVEQLKGLADTVKSIEFIGKAKTEALWQGNKMSLDELVKNVFVPKMLERGNNFSSDELHNREENRTASPAQLVLDKMASFLRASMAELKPQYFKSNAYDSHEILGPFHELFDQVFNANYRKVDMTREQSQRARALAEQLGKTWQKSIFDKIANKDLIDLKASEEKGEFVPLSLTRDNLIQMVAHAGNESNFDKLTKGYGWQPDQFWKFVDGKLSAKDVEAVKAQWEMANHHWPEVKAMYERMGQVVPPKVEGRAFRLKLDDGSTVELPGGYMPIRYDPLRSRLGEKKQAERAISADGERFGYDFFGRDTTTNGSLNARVDGYTDAIDLSHNAFERAMAETIHDLAYRETLVNVNKIITHPDFRKQFYRTFGREDYDALHTWLGRIANSENMDREVGNMGRVMRYTRTGMVMNAIALRASTVLKHGGSAAIKTMGYFVGGGEKYYLARQAAMATDYKAQMAEAIEKFPEIRARALQQDRDYRETVSSLYTPDKLQAKAERFGHAAVAWADLFTATATAHGAYDRAVTEGIPKSMGGTGSPMTHEQAVSYANQIVREAHGSQIESMRSNIMTNPHEGVKMFTTLYGFMNNTLGQTSDTVSKLKTAGLNKPEVMARAMMALVVPALWAGILTDGVPTKDDWKSWLGKALGSETLGMVPFARDAYSFLEGYKHAGVIGVESWMQTVLQPVIDATKAVEGKEVPGAISHAADAVGMGLHIPGLGQLGKTAQYLWDVHTGKQNPKDALEEAQGLTVGVHKKP